jgi:dTDP-glucose 4,6-dehydratase
VTGGAGFIGANYVHHVLATTSDRVVVFDKLTYAGNLANLADVQGDPRYTFIHADICDGEAVAGALNDFGVDTIVNFAAETHVDRSIVEPDAFIRTDVLGTHVLLEAARERGLRYHQVSTDEVYGEVNEGASVETDPLEPRSPYAASKAGGDMLVQAYHTTYGLHTTMTRGSNNVGPYQHPEKVVSLFATNAIDGLSLPVYGDGQQQRDYQWVGDHCTAIDLVVRNGPPGEIYNVGTGKSITNMEMVQVVLDTLGAPRSLVQHVTDRPGHDRRYALDIAKISALGWSPRLGPAESIARAVEWYRDNEAWWRPIKGGEFQAYYAAMYGNRAVIDAPGASVGA